MCVCVCHEIEGGGGPIVARTLMEEPEAEKGGVGGDSSAGVKNDIKIAQEGIGDGESFLGTDRGKRKTRGQTMVMEEERRCVCVPVTSKAERERKEK